MTVRKSGPTLWGMWTNGPYSKNFPERLAAKLVEEGVLRLDPDGSVWRLKKVYGPGIVKTLKTPKRIDYGPPGRHRNFKITLSPGVLSSVSLARFVWQVHKGDIPDRLTVNHKDGDPTNNTLDNLELATHSEQHIHRFKVLGHEPPGSRSKRLLKGFIEAARVALETGDLTLLKGALEAAESK